MFALSCDTPLPPVVCFDETLLFPLHPPEGLSSETQFVLYKSVVSSEMQFVLYKACFHQKQMQFVLYKACFHQKHSLHNTSQFHLKCSLGYTSCAFIRNMVCVIQVSSFIWNAVWVIQGMLSSETQFVLYKLCNICDVKNTKLDTTWQQFKFKVHCNCK